MALDFLDDTDNMYGVDTNGHDVEEYSFEDEATTVEVPESRIHLSPERLTYSG